MVFMRLVYYDHMNGWNEIVVIKHNCIFDFIFGVYVVIVMFVVCTIKGEPINVTSNFIVTFHVCTMLFFTLLLNVQIQKRPVNRSMGMYMNIHTNPKKISHILNEQKWVLIFIRCLYGIFLWYEKLTNVLYHGWWRNRFLDGKFWKIQKPKQIQIISHFFKIHS